MNCEICGCSLNPVEVMLNIKHAGVIHQICGDCTRRLQKLTVEGYDYQQAVQKIKEEREGNTREQ